MMWSARARAAATTSTTRPRTASPHKHEQREVLAPRQFADKYGAEWPRPASRHPRTPRRWQSRVCRQPERRAGRAASRPGTGHYLADRWSNWATRAGRPPHFRLPDEEPAQGPAAVDAQLPRRALGPPARSSPTAPARVGQLGQQLCLKQHGRPLFLVCRPTSRARPTSTASARRSAASNTGWYERERHPEGASCRRPSPSSPTPASWSAAPP